MNKFLKIFLAVACLIGVGSPAAKGETHYRPHISIGGQGGITMSQLSFSPGVDQTWKMGTQFGVRFRYTEEKLFGLVAELNFAQRGWSEKYDNSALSYSRTMNYISLPVMTHIYFGTSRFKGFVNLGPEVGFMVSDNISSNFDYQNPDKSEIGTRQTEQLTAKISNRLDYGITAGAGVEFYVKPRHSLTLECRFYYGLGNVFPSKRADTFAASRPMNLSVTAGYYFRMK